MRRNDQQRLSRWEIPVQLRSRGSMFPPFLADKISASNSRVIEDSRARALCTEMRRCLYYETCATYGLNVDRVFSEGECLPRSCARVSGSEEAGLGFLATKW